MYALLLTLRRNEVIKYSGIKGKRRKYNKGKPNLWQTQEVRRPLKIMEGGDSCALVIHLPFPYSPLSPTALLFAEKVNQELVMPTLWNGISLPQIPSSVISLHISSLGST